MVYGIVVATLHDMSAFAGRLGRLIFSAVSARGMKPLRHHLDTKGRRGDGAVLPGDFQETSLAAVNVWLFDLRNERNYMELLHCRAGEYGIF